MITKCLIGVFVFPFRLLLLFANTGLAGARVMAAAVAIASALEKRWCMSSSPIQLSMQVSVDLVPSLPADVTCG
jgi:hypothetical protein